jgi:16S rRNA (uracil1498-N3)-methyltransferase
METGDTCRLLEDRRHYLGSVLRMKAGDMLTLFDGCGNEYEGRIGRMSPTGLDVDIVKKYRIPEENKVRIALCQSLPKAGKMEFIIQKATELGIDRVVPFLSVRSVARPDNERARQKVARWRKIAVAAAQQCGRVDVPEVYDVVSFSEVLALAESAERRIIFWEEETQTGLRQVFSDTVQSRLIFVVVGPEGGFAASEIDEAVAKGFRTVSLGWRVLRVETAALAVMSIIQYETGGLGAAPMPFEWREDRP